jgi:tRNA threonylcarbamoyladenosine biosynthesis protein TsaB
MLVLGIDTSGREGGIALVSDGELLDSAPVAGGTFSAELVPQIATMLEQHGLRKSDLGGIAAISGPGSFTGLRVGLAAAKGLVEILRVPIATVSVLEAMALHTGKTGGISAALDAGRSEYYFGDFLVTAGRAELIREVLLAMNDFDMAAHGRVIAVCERTAGELARASGAQVVEVSRPGAEAAARIGAEKIARGETSSVEALEPNYIRRSDAEIFSTPRTQHRD